MFLVRLIKSVLQMRFTEAELLEATANNIKRPPFPRELYDALVSETNRDGQSIIEVWRVYFQREVHNIAESQTWQLQKASLLESILNHKALESVYIVADKAKYQESWRHLVKDHPHFQTVAPDGWKRRIFDTYLVAIATSACLLELGSRLFELRDTKENEIGLYLEYYKEIMGLDVSTQDLISDRIHGGEATTEEVTALQDLKNSRVNPVIDAQYRLLHVMKDEITNATLNIDGFKKKFEELEAAKVRLAEELNG